MEMESICKRNRHELRTQNFIYLFTSAWFSEQLLKCLNIHEIVNLDSSICNHFDRTLWNYCLQKSQLFLKLHAYDKDNGHFDHIMKWIHFKKISIFDLSLRLENGLRTVSNCPISILNPSVKAFKVESDHTKDSKHSELFQHILTFCPKLHEIDTKDNASKSGLSSIGEQLNQLQSIRICDVGHGDANVIDKFSPIDLIKLIKKNKHLEYIEVENMNLCGEVLVALGVFCPQIKSIHLKPKSNEQNVTDEQIETLTKGCRNLECFKIDFFCVMSCNKLLQHLGKYNPSLTVLQISGDHQRKIEALSVDSIIRFSKGCQRLREISFSYLNISAQCLSSLVKYGAADIEHLKFHRCEIANNGLADIAKLPSLKSLVLRFANSVTDQGIINLIKVNGHNLEQIDICYCNKITDASLMSIAANCPNLKKIIIFSNLDFFTDKGYWELFKRCRKLVNIEGMIPDELEDALKQRRREFGLRQ